MPYGLVSGLLCGSLVRIGHVRLLTEVASQMGSVREVAALDGLAAEAGKELGMGYRAVPKVVEGKKRR